MRFYLGMMFLDNNKSISICLLFVLKPYWHLQNPVTIAGVE